MDSCHSKDMAADISPQDFELIEEYCHYLQYEMNRSAHTIRSYRSDLTGLASDLQKSPEADELPAVFRDATLDDFRAWLAQLTQHGMSRTTMARKTTAVRQFMGWLMRQGIREDNPAARLMTSKQTSHLPDTLSQRQVRQALDALYEAVRSDAGDAIDPLALRDVAMFEVLYATGIRVAEIEGLDIGDIDFSRSTVKVTGKGDKQRVVPLTAPAVRALEQWLSVGRSKVLGDKPQTSAVFLGARGRRIGQDKSEK